MDNGDDLKSVFESDNAMQQYEGLKVVLESKVIDTKLLDDDKRSDNTEGWCP